MIKNPAPKESQAGETDTTVARGECTVSVLITAELVMGHRWHEYKKNSATLVVIVIVIKHL